MYVRSTKKGELKHCFNYTIILVSCSLNIVQPSSETEVLLDWNVLIYFYKLVFFWFQPLLKLVEDHLLWNFQKSIPLPRCYMFHHKSRKTISSSKTLLTLVQTQHLS